MSQVQEFYRKDIDGLRAIAILLVVAYHAGLPPVTGGFVGVDVFFVLSGYLITSLLVAEARRDGAISLQSFYARRIRRLLPALLVVVVVTCILGFFALLPIFDQQQDLARSGIATALYVSNFYFWLHAPGYFDQSSDLQPLLHTWSLSVEEQFYVVWPLMMLAIARVARVRGLGLERVLLIVISAILVASLAWCFVSTESNPTAAFYLLPSRAWELATGAALAVWLPRMSSNVNGVAGGICSLAGLAAIVIAAVILTDEMAFPGYWAMLPVFGTALVVTGGHIAPRNPLQLLLSTPPMVMIGLLSYSWYLWHWPLLALARAYKLEELNLFRDVGISALSLLLAYGSYRLVENPIRFGRPGPFRRTETTLVAGLAISVIMCLAAGSLGAWARFIGSKHPEYQSLVAASEDRPSLRPTCHQVSPFNGLAAAERCIAGDRARPVSVYLWGDSHADHLSPLMQEFAAVSTATPALVRSFTGCGPVEAGPTSNRRHDEACNAFNAAVLNEIRDLREKGLQGVVISGRWLRIFGAPTLRMLENDSGTSYAHLDDAERLGSLRDNVTVLTAIGLRVLIIAPVPEMRYSIPACLARRAVANCSVELSLVEEQRHAVMQLLDGLQASDANVRVLDLNDALCDATDCLAQKNGTILYLDDDHLTATASRALLPAAREALEWVAAAE